MNLHFDGTQPFQQHAVHAVADLFTGQSLVTEGVTPQRRGMRLSLEATALGVGNHLEISEAMMLQNLQAIQTRHGLPISPDLDGMHFSVEMETGTGKTYVYLRTIYELHQRYGFTKFIIVVPSVAIREGVWKNLEITRDHLVSLYGNRPVDAWVYDSKHASSLRQFALARHVQILVMNIDAFNKAENNVIHQERDTLSGYRPIEFIQATKPIVIVDEPQNMESDQARAAIDSLRPLCTLRYSATHRRPYNLVYRLDPVQAYQQRLVKRIEVGSILDDPDFNQPHIAVQDIVALPTGIRARIELDVEGARGITRQVRTITMRQPSLFIASGERSVYRGYVVEMIHAGHQTVTFTNGVEIAVGEAIGVADDAIMRVQIRQTVQEHLEKERTFDARFPHGQRIKVLSLFFIDRVAHYVQSTGKIRQWFLEAYTELAARPRYAHLALPPAEQVHGGYFAQDRHGHPKDTRGTTQADDAAYALIMRDKEQLLAPDEPLRFIFSHSALREGWDNPNVFQICTLNETRSEIKKRQEIGRGLRLPVNEQGERVWDPEINRLTIVANEHYDAFARTLQAEMVEAGVAFDPRWIAKRRDRQTVRLVHKWLAAPEFLELWNRIQGKTRYAVTFDTGALIQTAAHAVQDMPPIEQPRLRIRRGQVDLSSTGVAARLTAVGQASLDAPPPLIPDVIGYIQRQTELTRSTIAAILEQSGRLADLARDPQRFLTEATRVIQAVLQHLVVHGIKYERMDGVAYTMLRLSSSEREGFEEELQRYADRLQPATRSLYDAVECDSAVEERFAQGLEVRTDIKFYVKLPDWFKIPTPLGTYNPDWAIVKDEASGLRLYLVRETKGTTDWTALDQEEQDKIQCGKQHFAALATGIDYQWINSVSDV